MTKPKLLILGHARHGKDTVGDWFVKKGYTFVSSSRFVGEKVVYPYFLEREGLKPGPCASDRWPTFRDFEHCFETRHEWRSVWYDAIAAYNRPDRSRLGRELFAEYDMYVGLRNYHELEALRLHKAFDLCIWVDASERVEPEPSSSCTVTPAQADVIIDNNGTLDDLDKTLEVLYNKWVRPLEGLDYPMSDDDIEQF